MPSPRPLLLPLIRSCLSKTRHLPHRVLPSQPRRSAIPLLHQDINTPQRRPYSTPATASLEEPKVYSFRDIASLSTHPSPKRILIDVRERSELEETGRIPGAYSMPLTSNPDAFYLSDEDFLDRFGFEKPRADGNATSSSQGERRKGVMDKSPFSSAMKEREADSGLNADGVDSMKVNEEAGEAAAGGGEEHGEGVEEVIFYCKAGVRSRAAARMAREWEGVKAAQYPEGWMGWEKQGGKAER